MIEAASRQTWEDHRARQPHVFAENGWENALSYLYDIAFRFAEARPDQGSKSLYVAEAEGQIVGFILLSHHLELDDKHETEGSVSDIWVHPEWRKKGIGRNLVALAKDVAEAEDWDNLWAQVWVGAPWDSVFEEAGFSKAATHWRFGPDRPARPKKRTAAREGKQAASKTGQGDDWWKWGVLGLIILVFLAVVTAAE